MSTPALTQWSEYFYEATPAITTIARAGTTDASDQLAREQKSGSEDAAAVVVGLANGGTDKSSIGQTLGREAPGRGLVECHLRPLRVGAWVYP